MPDTFIPISEVEWVEQLVCDRYKVKIPKFLADYNQWWGDWEKERFRSMEENLKQGDILLDVGAETGWISAIYAQFVGARNMILVEPVEENWPNIRTTWMANFLDAPRACIVGFLGEVNQGVQILSEKEWPSWAMDGKLIEVVKYDHIDENRNAAILRINSLFPGGSFPYPNAITIDVEGFELQVLQGATRILEDIKPLVWASLHEGFVNRPGVNPRNQDVLDFMASMKYDAKLLGVDHEAHYFFKPQ